MKISPINFNGKHYRFKPKTLSYKTLRMQEKYNEKQQTTLKPVLKLHPKNFSRQYLLFEKDIVEYVLLNDEISLEEIEKIIHKYDPETSVSDIKNIKEEFTQQGYIASNTTGCFTRKYTIINTSLGPKLKNKEKTLYLSIPEKTDTTSKMYFLENLLHEGIHMLQDNSINKPQKMEILNSIIKKMKSTAQAIECIDILHKSDAYIEELISEFLYLLLSDKNITSKDINEEKINELLNNELQINLKECALAIILNYLAANNETDGIINDNDLMRHFALLINQEVEAYTKSMKSMNLICDTELYSTQKDTVYKKARTIIYKEILKQIKIAQRNQESK